MGDHGRDPFTGSRTCLAAGNDAGLPTGLDAEAIWEWGLVERLSTGLLGTRIDMRPVARRMLVAADRIAAQR